MRSPNKVTSADGAWRVLFALVAHWSAAAELLSKPIQSQPAASRVIPT
jgi:hypothetical protein